MHGELMMSRFDSPARATRCAGALREAAAYVVSGMSLWNIYRIVE